MRLRSRWLGALALVAVLALAPSTAFGALTGRIVEGVGVKTAKLGLKDSTDAKRIGGSYKRSRDTSYAGQTVWRYNFGKKSSATGHYPLQMYSHGDHKVFTFVIYCTTLKTKNGTHVGTTEGALVSRYGSRITKAAGPVYVQYYMGTRSGRTEFWVRGGKIHHITIARY